MKWQRIFLCLFILYVGKVKSLQKILTINIDPGKKDCFFQFIKQNDTLDLEYQVIDGGHGDLDITFSAIEPGGRLLHLDVKKSENVYQMAAQRSGDYQFCFDNTFSSYNTKTVFFDLFAESEDYWGNNEHFDFNIPDVVSEDEVYELKVEDIIETIGNVREHLTKARHLQDVFKSFEARDRNIVEENYFTINSFSFFQVIVMVTVGIIQVIMVRSLFDDRSKVSKIWKRLDPKY
ncbi:hypothetical protein PPYR_15487 [Photinus pyralis]|uniref:GOLD domain-containing protein n=1 Tax=Photinus pyralis TaxID=7054 RepID=A0A1Y1MGC1_PHOPY|nr:transmembrane emp24 domain-containing protein 5-like [Photinus pyralis]XP_031359048.1 transmembrane emp24 domain-containing protein 5-like [Photinus pyralis]KAB0790156.1 hypothetical protein PPYR_15521 [Photinus pyralis]KAB0790188.1 hypothetical protein PPYR_15487 [Photinus pyralis]